MEQARRRHPGTPGSAEPERLAAVATLRARGDFDARAMLASLSDQPQSVREAAATAVIAIDRQMQLWGLAQGVFYGLSLGSVLLLAAASLAITSRRDGRDQHGPRAKW
jgi:urea transport system permease protein